MHEPNKLTRILINEIAAFIREKGEVSFGELCFRFDRKPSTMQGYKRILIAVFQDITYENDAFKVVKQP